MILPNIVKNQHCPTHRVCTGQHVIGCYWQHLGSTGLEPGLLSNSTKGAHSISCNRLTTELPESFHGSGAVILEASRWALTGRGLDPRTLGDSRQQLEQQRVAAQYTTTATTRKRNKLNNKVRRKRAWSQLYSVGDSLQQGWQRHMR